MKSMILQAYGKRQNRVSIATPSQQVDMKQHNVLQVGDKKPHPSHIPEHLPSFPDTHTYWLVIIQYLMIFVRPTQSETKWKVYFRYHLVHYTLYTVHSSLSD